MWSYSEVNHMCPFYREFSAVLKQIPIMGGTFLRLSFSISLHHIERRWGAWNHFKSFIIRRGSEELLSAVTNFDQLLRQGNSWQLVSSSRYDAVMGARIPKWRKRRNTKSFEFPPKKRRCLQPSSSPSDTRWEKDLMLTVLIVFIYNTAGIASSSTTISTSFI